VRALEVRLIAADGSQIGIVPLEKAQQLALEAQLDLVEVAPQASPPVCKIMDYDRLIYEQKRRAKDARKKARHHDLKEIKLRPNTDQHDYATKMVHAREFLSKGHKVKLTVMYRGREMAHFERGTAILRRVQTDLADEAEVEMAPNTRGRTQSMVVAPRKKQASHQGDGA